MATVMPPMSAAQERACRALFEPRTFLCLVRGQMVHLYCAERGFTPNRPTEDADTVLDVRARPDILGRFTRALIEMGWTSAGESLESHQHRWLKDRSQIDVFIPTNAGQTAAGRRGATRGTTLETRGGQQAVDRAELVIVEVADEVGQVPPAQHGRRPGLSKRPHGRTSRIATAIGI